MKSKQIPDDNSLLDVKVNELLLLLEKGTIDREHVKIAQQKINQAIDASSLPQKIEAFRELDEQQNRLDMVTNLELLLTHHQIDSEESKKYLLQERLKNIVLIGIAITMVLLGLAMIIMPAPPYFEMFTIFYFSNDDGITLMDVISVLIVLTGVYLFLSTVLKKANS